MFWTETLEVDIEGMTQTHASSNWYTQGLWTLHLLLLIFFKHTWGEGLWWSTSPRAPPYKTIRRLAWLGTSQAKTYVNGYWSNWRRHFHIDYKGFFCYCHAILRFLSSYDEKKCIFGRANALLTPRPFSMKRFWIRFYRETQDITLVCNTLKKILKAYCHNT